MDSINNSLPDTQSQNIWDIVQRVQKAININAFRKIVKIQYPKVALALSRFQEYLKSAAPAISSENKIFSDIEDIFYIMPKEQKIYCFYDKIKKVFAPRLLKDYIENNLQCKAELDENTLYALVADLLTNIARVQPCGHLFNRYLHKIYRANNGVVMETVFQYPYSYFIKIDSIICFIYKAINGGTAVIPLTNDNLDFITSHILHYPNMPQQLKRIYTSALRKCTSKKYPHSQPIGDLIQYKSSDCLLDAAGKEVRFEQGKFISRRHEYNEYTDNILPQQFTFEKYAFSDTVSDLLAKITGNSRKSFNTLAKLTAAAYSNGSPLKSATVIVADDNSYYSIKTFFARLFQDRICYLCRDDYHNIESHYDIYLNARFNGCKAHIIDGKILPVNYDGIRKLIKSTYIEAKDNAVGKIRFKNRIPLIVLTKDEEYARQFNIRVNSDIIKIEADTLPIDKISDYEFAMLRQALSLYGLELFSVPPKKEKNHRERGRSDEAIVNSFIQQFCKTEPESFVSKIELRKAFAEYASIYYPYFNSSPIAVCNRLRDMGFDGKHKKRVDGFDNPVAVIRDIEFDRVKFKKKTKFTIEPTKKLDVEKAEQASFDILSELSSAKIDLEIGLPYKRFNV